MGAVVFNEAGDILLIKRGKAPHYGRWMVPGGTLEFGETLEEGTRREVLEETGIEIEIETFVEIVEAISPGGEGGFHFVIMDYAAHAISGTLAAGSDALAAVFVPITSLGSLDLTEDLVRVIANARRITNRA